MVLHPVPHVNDGKYFDAADLNSWTSTRLWQLAKSNSSDRDLLKTIRRLLERRTGSRSIQARDWIDTLLSNEGVVGEASVRQSRSTNWKYVAATGGIVLIGFGQAIGEDIWHTAKPTIESLVLLVTG